MYVMHIIISLQMVVVAIGQYIPDTKQVYGVHRIHIRHPLGGDSTDQWACN